MARPGKHLEQLITNIERVLANDPSAIIESPKRLPDRTTGQLREHDVVLTITQGHHTVLVAIECRDRSRPIGVPQVEAFSAKCLDTGINQGIIVSPTGFCKTARRKASHLGIRCLDLEEADSFNWLLAPGVIVATKKLLHQDWKFFPEEEGVVIKETLEILTPDGKLLDESKLTPIALRLLDEKLPPEIEAVEEDKIRIRLDGGGLLLRNSETGATTPVKWIGVTLTYSVVRESTPFQLAQYRDKADDRHITDVAVAELKFGDRIGNLMIVYKEDEGGKVTFVSNPSSDT